MSFGRGQTIFLLNNYQLKFPSSAAISIESLSGASSVAIQLIQPHCFCGSNPIEKGPVALTEERQVF